MELKDLKTGMVVETRDGSVYRMERRSVTDG